MNSLPRFEVAPHPWIRGRWTHLVRQEAARACGWHVYGNLALGVWRSRSGAAKSARQLERLGVAFRADRRAGR